MPTSQQLSADLGRLLRLEHPPVAVTFHEDAPDDARAIAPPEPAGCCFWARGERAQLQTTAADHANCSVGSYTHGLIGLTDAAGGEDTAALVASGWVAEADLLAAPHLKAAPGAITYEPLETAGDPDVVLMRLSPWSLMTLQGACPKLSLVTKPQCQIVPLAADGAVTVSPGCAVSRVRTGLPPGELTCALPARELAGIVERIARSSQADEAVGERAGADLRENYGRAPGPAS
jgi:uncharacterized protein (DUF169 family)